MNPNKLFCRTIDDIKNVIDTPDDYEILRSSALLRQLLIDGNRLTDVVNKEIRQKIVFRIVDHWETEYTKLVLSHKPSFYAVLDGLTPDVMPNKIQIVELSRDKFFSHKVILTDGKLISIRDIIDHCSNVLGGVHLGDPRSKSQEALSNLHSIKVGGATVSLRQLLPILQVVYKALLPLREALREKL
ncbi:MAG: hypothetical protein AB1Y31_11755 [Cycloclasticus sp.]